MNIPFGPKFLFRPRIDRDGLKLIVFKNYMDQPSCYEIKRIFFFFSSRPS